MKSNSNIAFFTHIVEFSCYFYKDIGHCISLTHSLACGGQLLLHFSDIRCALYINERFLHDTDKCTKCHKIVSYFFYFLTLFIWLFFFSRLMKSFIDLDQLIYIHLFTYKQLFLLSIMRYNKPKTFNRHLNSCCYRKGLTKTQFLSVKIYQWKNRGDTRPFLKCPQICVKRVFLSIRYNCIVHIIYMKIFIFSYQIVTFSATSIATISSCAIPASLANAICSSESSSVCPRFRVSFFFHEIVASLLRSTAGDWLVFRDDFDWPSAFAFFRSSINAWSIGSIFSKKQRSTLQ